MSSALHAYTRNQQRIYDAVNKKEYLKFMCFKYYSNGVTS